MKLYMFRTVPLSVIRSLFTVRSKMVYVIQVYRQLSSRTKSCSKTVYKPVWHIPLLSVQWIKSWWWTDELSETCRVSRQNKFLKLVHLVGFVTKKPYSYLFHSIIPFRSCRFIRSGALFTELEWPEREVYYPLLCSDNLRNVWGFNSTPLHAVVLWCVVKHYIVISINTEWHFIQTIEF
jgi:hypothetical protein